MRLRALASITLASALVGGIAVLVVAWAAGWLHGERRTVVFKESTPAVQTSRARPQIGGAFDPARIYSQRSAGVVTIYAVFGSGAGANASQGSGFVVSSDGLILTNSHVISTAGEGSGEAAGGDGGLRRVR